MALVPDPASSDHEADSEDDCEVGNEIQSNEEESDEDVSSDLSSIPPTLPEELENILDEIEEYQFPDPTNNDLVLDNEIRESNICGDKILIIVPPATSTEIDSDLSEQIHKTDHNYSATTNGQNNLNSISCVTSQNDNTNFRLFQLRKTIQFTVPYFILMILVLQQV